MKKHLIAGALASLLCAGPALATPVFVLDGSQGWANTDTRPGGTTSIENGPGNVGALKLSTNATNAAKAEVGIFGNFGTVSSLISNGFSISYDWFDVSGTGVAAPSIKLAFYNAGFAGDGYGQLVFEPYAQGASATSYITPTQDVWNTTTVDLNNGRSWNTGMFGVGSSFAGPPNNTLAEWLPLFDSAFQNAQLVGVSIGLGSFNPSEMGFVDNVNISGTLLDDNYDFSVVPVPAALPLMLTALGFFGIGAWRRSSRTT